MGVLLIKYISNIIFVICFTTSVFCQLDRIELFVHSINGDAIPDANVLIFNLDSTLYSFYISKENGSVRVDNLNHDNAKLISINALGYKPIEYKPITNVLRTSLKSDTVYLDHQVYNIQETTIKAEPPKIYTKSDTIIYNLSEINIDQKQRLEDYFRELDGFEVKEGGKIYAGGKEVTKILLDHTDLVGESYQKISKNIDADIVENIEIISNFEEDVVKSKYFDSKEVGINLDLKDSVQNVSGNTSGKIGNPGRWGGALNSVLLTKKVKSLLTVKHSQFSESFADMDIGYKELQNDDYYFNRLASPNQITKNHLFSELPSPYRYSDNQNEVDVNTAFNVNDHKFRFTGNRHSNNIQTTNIVTTNFQFPNEELSFSNVNRSELWSNNETYHFGGEYKWGSKDEEYHNVEFNAIIDKSTIDRNDYITGDFNDTSLQNLHTAPFGLFLNSRHSFSLDKHNALFVSTRFLNQNTYQNSNVYNNRWHDEQLFANDKGFIQSFNENDTRAKGKIILVHKNKQTTQAHGLIGSWESKNLLMQGVGQMKVNPPEILRSKISIAEFDYQYLVSWPLTSNFLSTGIISSGITNTVFKGDLKNHLNYSFKWKLSKKGSLLKRISCGLSTERKVDKKLLSYYFTYFAGTQSIRSQLDEIKPSTRYNINVLIRNNFPVRSYTYSLFANFSLSRDNLILGYTEDPVYTVLKPYYTDMSKWIMNGNIEFMLTNILAKLKFSLSYNGSIFDQLINGLYSNTTQHSFNPEIHLTKPLGSKLNTTVFLKPSYSIYVNSESATSRNIFFNAGAKALWTPSNKFRLTAYYKYINGEVILEPFHLFDIVAKYTISNRWGMTLKLQNLMNYTFYGKSQNLNFYTYSREIIIPGRTVSLSVGYSF